VDLQLTNKTAFVTGSTAGIGLAIAEALAAEGASVIVNGRTEERVSAAVKTILRKSPRAKVSGVAADLGAAEGAAIAIRQIPDLDILVNNVGIYAIKPFEELTDDDWMKIFDVNVMSGVRLSRHYLPLMKKKNWGRIVFISSESGINTPVEMVHYGVTKTAQLALARGLAETTVGTAVTVNSVLPGPTESEGVATFVEQAAKSQGVDRAQVEKHFFQRLRPSSLIQRFATTAEVAALVTFVCSPLSSATNGAALRVDGGVVRSIT
jgi:NAD(P)-dependent dehydrogenase (short-subunit alcohol dehydrogenase family)